VSYKRNIQMFKISFAVTSIQNGKTCQGARKSSKTHAMFSKPSTTWATCIARISRTLEVTCSEFERAMLRGSLAASGLKPPSNSCYLKMARYKLLLVTSSVAINITEVVISLRWHRVKITIFYLDFITCIHRKKLISCTFVQRRKKLLLFQKKKSSEVKILFRRNKSEKWMSILPNIIWLNQFSPGEIEPPAFAVLGVFYKTQLRIKNKPHFVGKSNKSLNCYFNGDLQYAIKYWGMKDNSQALRVRKLFVIYKSMPFELLLISKTKCTMTLDENRRKHHKEGSLHT